MAEPMTRSHWLLGFGAFFALVLSHLIWGQVDIALFEPLEAVHREILLHVRIPRVLAAVAGGAGLSLCGLVLQTWFSNPLAGPSVLGVSSGAGLGVAFLVLMGVTSSWWATAAAAMAGSALVLVLVLFVAHRFRTATALLIFGLMLNYVVGAMITVLQAEAQQEALQQFVFWGMGTFAHGSLATSLALCGAVLFAGLVLNTMHRDLDMWTLGSLTAQSMGVSDSSLRWRIVALAGLLTGGITAACGPLAFLGLATPHVVRLLTADRSHRVLIPMTALTGAMLALAADWGVKGYGGMEHGWPLNAVLSLIGGPMVIWVLVSKTDRLHD
jgi:iron complex transport system permease protein